MKRYAFLYNPAARGGKSEAKVTALENRIKKLPQATLFRSQSKGDISLLIEQLIHDYEIFVACGGDGTIQEVASKLLGSEKTMGIIPLGSGNDLCKTLRIPVNLEKSLDLVFSGKTVTIDVGRCNDFIFLNTLGFGFDGLTNLYALEMENIHPFFRYAVSALKAAIKQDRFKVQISTESGCSQQKVIMVSLANGKVEGGSFWIAPKASITDGKLNLVTIRPVTKWLIPFLMPFFLFKKPGLIPYVQSKEIDEISLEFEDSIEIHADGEIIENNTNKFDIYLASNGLNVITGF